MKYGGMNFNGDEFSHDDPELPLDEVLTRLEAGEEFSVRTRYCTVRLRKRPEQFGGEFIVKEEGSTQRAREYLDFTDACVAFLLLAGMFGEKPL